MIVVPDIAPVAPEPTMVAPAEVPEPAPFPEAAAQPAAPEPAPAEPRMAPRTADRAEPAAASPAPSAEPSPVAEPVIPAVADVADEAPVEVDPSPPLEVEQAANPDAGVDTAILALAIGGLAFLALAIWGFIAIGRRKPVRRYAAVAPAPEARQPIADQPRRAVVTEQAPARPIVEPLVPARAGGLPHAGAAIALPRRLPDSFAEREALFRRMVDARPDRANPFSDRRARMKRARLIMQSLGRDFGDARPWIDLSQYPHNWPELARHRSAAA